jgi:hypothetical protein
LESEFGFGYAVEELRVLAGIAIGLSTYTFALKEATYVCVGDG